MSRAGSPLTDPNARVAAGETIELVVPPAEEAEPAAEKIPLDIVFEDSDLIVIDKPAGLVVHPGAGNITGTLVNALIAHCGESLSGIGGVKRPGIVHRLDKDTSGLLVVAKNDAAHRALSAQFADHGRDGPLAPRIRRACLGRAETPYRRRSTPPSIAISNNRQKQAVAPVRRAAARSPIMRSTSGSERSLAPGPAGWKRAARTKSACIWRISGIRCRRLGLWRRDS